MQVIPVLDLMGGVVVRGIAGRRAEYRPVASRLTDSTRPADVAAAFHDRLALSTAYVADLDAIAGAPPTVEAYQAIQQAGLQVWVDAGVRHSTDAERLLETGVDRVVVGLETIEGPGELAQIVKRLGASRVVFSLDLRAGQPMGEGSHWSATDAEGIAAEAIAVGVSSMIVLDLSRVGVGEGLGTETLCQRLREAYSDLELIAGGGVRSMDDLRRLKSLGVDAVLVASALHDGRITSEDVASLID